MNIPKYPESFFDFGKGIDISNVTINEWIEDMFKELDENPDLKGLSRATGNTYVSVNRDDCAKYRVFVTKNYQEKSIY